MDKCLAFLLLALLAWLPARAQVDDALAREVRQLTEQAAGQPLRGARIEVELGELDPRLRLAPCQQVQPYLPPGARPWGRTRIGLRCLAGSTAWNVYLPITVRVHAPALVLAAALPAGSVLEDRHFVTAEVDWAAETGTPLAALDQAVGRSLAQPLAAGAALRTSHLKIRQWFAAGDSVRIVAKGSGYAVSGEGQALSPGLEGRPVRVRTESGRVVSGLATGERLIEVAL